MKHTPGPWDMNDQGPEVSTPRFTIDATDNRGPWLVATVTRPADAQLIAAAPDLKTELIAYHDREWMESHEGLPKHKAGDYPDECGGCAAVAKAEGVLR